MGTPRLHPSTAPGDGGRAVDVSDGPGPPDGTPSPRTGVDTAPDIAADGDAHAAAPVAGDRAGRSRRVTAATTKWSAVVVLVASLGLVAASGPPLGRALRAVEVLVVGALLLWLLAARPAARPWLALLVGTLALAVGLAVGPAHAARGLSATAVCGLVLAVSGLSLLVCGIVLAVQAWRGWHRALVVPLLLVALQFVGQPVFAAVVVSHAPRTPPGGRVPTDAGFEARPVTFSDAEGVELAGWHAPSRNGATVVVVPGSGSEASAALDQAAVLARAGYGVLLTDPRGQGRSGGHAMALGWWGGADLRAAVDFLQREEPAATIGVLGLSMGGEEALTAAAEDPRVRAVVAEGVGRRVPADHGPGDGTNELGLEPVLLAVQFALVRVLSGAPEPAGLDEVMARTPPRRVLLVSGDGEGATARRYAEAAGGGSVEVWDLPDAPHVGALASRPGEWSARVVGFFDRALLVTGAAGGG